MMDSKDRVAVGGLVFFILIIVSFAVLMVVGGRKVPNDIPVMQFVSGTEYNVGEAGQVIIEARFENGSSALLYPCVFSIVYPNKLTFLVQNGTTGSNGNQYVMFTVPNVTGVYEYQANCTLVTGNQGVISKSFHVSEFQNATNVLLHRVNAEITK